MHISWKKRRPQNGLHRNSIILEALLVDSYADNGSVKRKLVAHLGGIDEKFLISKVSNMREFHQGLFWAGVNRKLDRLKLDTARRDRIEAVICQTVARPHPDWALWGVTCIPRFDP